MIIALTVIVVLCLIRITTAEMQSSRVTKNIVLLLSQENI